MMGMSEIVEKLQGRLGSGLVESRVQRARRVFARVGAGAFKEAAGYAVLEMGFDHLSTITGIDLGGELEVIYHLAQKNATTLSLSVRVPKGDPVLPTISDIMPNAAIYEREVHDLLGVGFKGLQDKSPLLLPDGWPDGVHPLRKEIAYSELHEIRLKKG